jgi:predicted RNase H-like HicB family nuclease
VKSYIAIAEPSDDGKTWWISFPSLPGVTSAASSPADSVFQAQDALASALGTGVALPPSIEEGVIPYYDLNEFHNPLVVLVPYTAPAPASAG